MPYNYINVKQNFGAKGNGVDDDTAAINAAELLASQQGISLYFPAGNYLISSSITKRSNSTWVGENQLVKILPNAGFSGNQLLVASNRSNFKVQNIIFDGQSLSVNKFGYAEYGTASGITFENCQFLNLAPSGTSFGAGIYTLNAHTVDVIDCKFENCLHPFRVAGGTINKLKIRNNKIRLCGNALELSIGANSKDIWIEGNHSSEPTAQWSAYYLTGGNNYTFSNVFITNNVAIGNNLAFSQGGSADLFSLKDMRQYSICGNHATQGGDLGFAVERSDNGSVVGNTADYNNSVGIGCAPARNVTVVGNVCQNNTQDRANEYIVERPYGGIRLDLAGQSGVFTNDIVITGNVCNDTQGSKTQKYGISVMADTHGSPSGIYISDNICDGNLYGEIFNNTLYPAFHLQRVKKIPDRGQSVLGESIVIDGTVYKCTQTGGNSNLAWQQSTSYSVGDTIYTTQGLVWVCKTSGISAPSGIGPLTGATERTDGTVVWRNQALTRSSWSSITSGVNGSGVVYSVVTASDGDQTPSVNLATTLVFANSSGTSIYGLDSGDVGQEINLLVDSNTTILHSGGSGTYPFLLDNAVNFNPSSNGGSLRVVLHSGFAKEVGRAVY